MLRALLRLILVLVILAAGATFLLGWWGRGHAPALNLPSATGTTGRVDADRARAAGAEVGERTAQAAHEVRAELSDAALTAKIKSKMALDDTVKASDIRVTTEDHIVTLRGPVGSIAEHDRAVQLAKETNGVRQVVDHLGIER
jgi:osmotically-inducible protein OsmY